MCQKERLIELLHDFVLFDGGVKKLPRVHQYFGVKAAESLAPDHPTLGDVNSPADLERYQEWKRAYKKASKGA
jgi:type I site-specific restriction-modification system R (restriction) subunit